MRKFASPTWLGAVVGGGFVSDFGDHDQRSAAQTQGCFLDGSTLLSTRSTPTSYERGGKPTDAGAHDSDVARFTGRDEACMARRRRNVRVIFLGMAAQSVFYREGGPCTKTGKQASVPQRGITLSESRDRLVESRNLRPGCQNLHRGLLTSTSQCLRPMS